MNLNKDELIKEIQNEKRDKEELAFKMYCKDTLMQALSNEERTQKEYIKARTRLGNLTIDNLKSSFNDDFSMHDSPKEIYLKKLSEKK